MARTVIPLQAVTPDVAVAPTYTAFDNANGMYIAAGRTRGHLLLEFKNVNAAARTVTIKAGVGGDLGLGWRAGLGDNAITVPLTTGDMQIVLRDFARYTQADGSINIDCSGSNVTVYASTL